MEIVLPTKKETPNNTNPKIEIDSLVIIGANGAGKTRFGAEIEKRHFANSHRISAQKSLVMPITVSTKSIEVAEIELYYGYYSVNANAYKNPKKNHRWGEDASIKLLNDFDKLLVLLHTEEYEKSVAFKDNYNQENPPEKLITKLDKIQSNWESILTHRKLIKKSGTFEAHPIGQENKQYNASKLSDGERVIFYIIGAVLCAPSNAIMIIDEPEMHLHKSVCKELYNKVEELRPDCTFVYLTHDLDFAFSRSNATKIWMKEYHGNLIWDYHILEEGKDFPTQLHLEILGSRKPILFIEGEEDSIDYKLYPIVFKDYTIKSLGSCGKVINVVKSFNDLEAFHHISSVGLIDRDRRTDYDIRQLNSNNIWVCDVAEIENILLLEDIIKEIIVDMKIENPENIISQIKNNVITFFSQELNNQALIHLKGKIYKEFQKASSPNKSIDFTTLKLDLNSFWNGFDFDREMNLIKGNFQSLIDTKDYYGILKVFNNKGIIHQSKVMDLCDLSTRNGGAYLRHIIRLIKQNNQGSEKIINSIKRVIKK